MFLCAICIFLCCVLFRMSCIGQLWRFRGLVWGRLVFHAWQISAEFLLLPRWTQTFPARQHTGKSAHLPAIGRKRTCPPPESAKLRDFFCTPQRAGIQRVTPVSREIPENFSKISSPKIWCVCQKSVPLHSQIRNEAYNTSQI